MKRWTGLVWLDSGKDLGEGPVGPWTDYADNHHVNHTIFYPTIQVSRKSALKSHQMSIKDDLLRQSTSHAFTQSSALLGSEYGKSLDEKLIATNQFYSFHELFQFCAFSYAQYLNMVEYKLNNDTAFYKSSELIEDQSHNLHRQRTIEMHAGRLRGTIETIKKHSDLNEEKMTESTPDTPQKIAAKKLMTDYEQLLMRAEKISAQCQAQMTLLMNQAMIAESSKAIRQAREVTKLTRLAFVFVPLGFTTSICGMNLWPFVKEGPSLGVWFAISIPFLLLSFLLMSFDMGNLWDRFLKHRSKFT